MHQVRLAAWLRWTGGGEDYSTPRSLSWMEIKKEGTGAGGDERGD